MKFVIVDDDPRIREALVTGLQLQWQAAEVLEAADGEAGLQLIFDANPDVVLLDITMPRMTGFEVLKEIRRTSDVPVILLTARGEEMDQVRGLELGADDYLVKPIKHAAGLGVREIARGSGLSAGTVSRWIRIADNRPVLEALERGRIDLFRAMHLAVVHDEAVLAELIANARDYSPDAFYSIVQQRVAASNTLQS